MAAERISNPRIASKTLTTAEKKWPTYEKEAYAVRWAVQQFKDYLKTGHVFVLTDHQSLQWMRTATSGKLLRWSLYLQQFDMEIRHLSGECIMIADWLSRSMDTPDPFNDADTVAIPILSTTTPTLTTIALPAVQTLATPYSLPLPLPTVETIKEVQRNCSPEELRDTYEGPDKCRYHIRTNRLFIPYSLREIFLY